LTPPILNTKKLIVIGNTGDGKSTFLNLIAGEKVFEEGEGIDSETLETNYKTCNFFGEEMILCDTQGLSDTRGYDTQHIPQMVEKIKNLQYINTCLIVLNGTNVKFSQHTQQTIRFFITMFSNDILKNIVLIFTHWNIATEPIARENMIRNQYNEKFKELFSLQTEVPCFFIDSHYLRRNNRNQPRYHEDDVSNYNARLLNLYATICSMDPLNVRNIVVQKTEIQQLKDKLVELENRKPEVIYRTIYENYGPPTQPSTPSFPSATPTPTPTPTPAIQPVPQRRSLWDQICDKLTFTPTIKLTEANLEYEYAGPM
jgi:predicted GTPase